MMITVKDIDKLAELARLKISDEEKTHLASEIEAILAYVKVRLKTAASRGTQRRRVTETSLRSHEMSHQSGTFTWSHPRRSPG